MPALKPENPLRALLDHGQAVWLDYIRRNLIRSGDLARLIDEDGLRGVTSNPAIFEKAIAGSDDYQETIRTLNEQGVNDVSAIYDRVVVADIQAAADVLRPTYDRTNGRDGYVSLEVDPRLGHQTSATIDQARRLWKLVDRPNLMIKVPGTAEGIPAVRQLISEGINVNITLLFAVAMYKRVLDAYIEGLEQRIGRGEDVSRVASVASFFVSRIDSAIDPLLAKQGNGAELAGKVAIANAKIAYEAYLQVMASDRWRTLESKGAQRQRLLWASTSTKNPAYRDVMYVEELIGPETVNTMPPATLDAFREHGKVRDSLTEDLPGAHRIIDRLPEFGVSLDQVTDKLVEDGLKIFEDAFAKLMEVLKQELVCK